eukprot:TRINITY_DN78016_c0_g1_i1.p1 TRINITY_DN78016_c0_g1~~TRINITY_DN78016_c0_g1_i1.p1  ORF type:complete len:157 (-),score=18.86 TRINITY_DN78016_c0_g1_i1:121-591(-)
MSHAAGRFIPKFEPANIVDAQRMMARPGSCGSRSQSQMSGRSFSGASSSAGFSQQGGGRLCRSCASCPSCGTAMLTSTGRFSRSTSSLSRYSSSDERQQYSPSVPKREKSPLVMNWERTSWKDTHWQPPYHGAYLHSNIGGVAGISRQRARNGAED